jgi:DNA-binding NarL/FixJ family response regulator
MTIKITITDDHPLVVSGLKSILKPSKEIQVIATYSSGQELLAGLEQVQPDVLVTDLQMPGQPSGIELVALIRERYPDLPVLILSGQEALFNVQDMMEQGCKGYLLKNSTDTEMLVRAIEEVHMGGIFLEPSLKDELLQTVLRDKKDQLSNVLSRREIEVLKLIEAGLSSQEIADKLCRSVRTIESHRLRLLQKLDVRNVGGLIKKAASLGLLD